MATRGTSGAGMKDSGDGGIGGDPDAAVLSTPSAEHTQRWRNIDQLLDSAVGVVSTSSMDTPPGAGAAAEADNDSPVGGQRGAGTPAVATLSPPPTGTAVSLSRDPSGSSSGSASQAAAPRAAAAAPVAMSAAAAAAAERYPLLFAATRSNEDVMMAAARLLEEHDGVGDGNVGGGAAAAAAAATGALVQEAVNFLENEVGASEDGAAAVWQLPAPA